MGNARTRAEYEGACEIREIQHLFLEQIARAKKFIYAENQYFASPKIADAIAERMKEPNPPEIVIVGPEPAERVTQLLDSGSSMREIIEGAQGNGPWLERLDLPKLDDTEKVIAENAILDPENPDEMFEPFSSPGLFARVRKLRKPRE